MKKCFTLLFALSALALSLQAQDVDNTFVFVDAEANVFENGAMITRTEVVPNGLDGEKIDAGVYVLNTSGGSDFIKMHYTINQIDNGAFQICFPSTCNTKDAVGTYETSAGQLMGNMQDIMSEWLPVADGVCDVTLLIEVMTKKAGFPPSYEHKAYGPTLTIKFVKGDAPGPEPLMGDVNGDGEVNISDVNSLIDIVLSGRTDNNAADVNKDGEINISDVNALIDIILS
jgi:hypothetical protein